MTKSMSFIYIFVYLLLTEFETWLNWNL